MEINDLKINEDAGINISFIQPIATKPEQTTGINKWAIESQDENIRFFGTLHPDFPYWKDEIKVLAQAGIKGIKFHPDYQNFFVDEPRLIKISEKIFEAGLIILFHAGIDIGLPKPYHCTPQKLKKVLDSFPGLRLLQLIWVVICTGRKLKSSLLEGIFILIPLTLLQT